MAGHSKWANIKHKKAKTDAKRGKVFSRIAKEVISAVKQGGPDPQGNPRLRLVLQKAKAANVPNDVIARNIKKGSAADQADFTEMTYELYGHGGVGIIAEVMTDNKNRISSDMHIATMKRGGTVATPGSVAFNYDHKGLIKVALEKAEEDELFMTATEAGAEDFEVVEEVYMITTDPKDLFNVKEEIEKMGFESDDAELIYLPKSTVEVDEKTMKANLALLEWIEELDDVDAVYHNMEIS